jgi:phosphatidylinositol glycan class U
MSFTDLNVVLPALITGRLWLAYSSLPAYLRDHQLLSSPLTAYSRCAPTLRPPHRAPR